MPIDETSIACLSHVASKLHLVFTKDDVNQKVYVDNTSAAPTTANTIKFPLTALTPTAEPTSSSNHYYAGNYAKRGPLFLYNAQTKHIKLSDNFTLNEFACHDAMYTNYVRVHPSLIYLLELIRIEAGAPIHITSAYRPAPYNASIGGASVSQHVAGTAADIYCDGISTTKLCNIADSVIGPKGGVGYYPAQGFVHVDVRDEKARWEE